MFHQEAKSKAELLPNAHQLQEVMQRTISLLAQKLSQEKIQEISQAFHSLCWDFKDHGIQVYLSISEAGQIKYVPDISTKPDVTVTLNASTLHDSAYGKTTFGLAFITGKLKLKGVPALKVTKFAPLLKPFLESYRQTWEEYRE